MPRNSLVNGKTAPDSFNNQLDEAAYPILMACSPGSAATTAVAAHPRGRGQLPDQPRPDGFGPERWEEQGGYSPSTIAAEIAGLVAAGAIAQAARRRGDARVWLATADQYQRSIKGWTVTTQRPAVDEPVLHPAVQDR